MTASRPVFCVFGTKFPHTFWGKCAEQSKRKKLAEGGLEPVFIINGDWKNTITIIELKTHNHVVYNETKVIIV